MIVVRHLAGLRHLAPVHVVTLRAGAAHPCGQVLRLSETIGVAELGDPKRLSLEDPSPGLETVRLHIRLVDHEDGNPVREPRDFPRTLRGVRFVLARQRFDDGAVVLLHLVHRVVLHIHRQLGGRIGGRSGVGDSQGRPCAGLLR